MAEMLPPIDKVTLVVTTAFGEVLSTLPPEYRPDPISMIPKEFLGGADHMTPEVLARGEMLLDMWLGSTPAFHDASARLGHCDAAGHRHTVRVADVRLQPDLVGQARDAREHCSDPRRLQHLGVRPAGQLGPARPRRGRLPADHGPADGGT